MQIAALSLADGQASPVTHTFDVTSAQQGTIPATWDDRSGGTIADYTNLTMSVRKTNGSSYKVELRITDPTLDVDGAVKHKCLAVMSFSLPMTSSLQNRQDILAYAKNALDSAIVVDGVHNLSPAY